MKYYPTHARHSVLTSAVPMPQDRRLQALRAVLIVMAGTAFIALSARIQVPMWPVPITMQSFAVLMVGMTFGARLAGITLLAYLVQGAFGLPVFAGGGGVAYLIGPTAGYLLGFAAAAVAVGWLADRGWTKGYLPAFGAACLGTGVIHAFGAVWLTQFVEFDQALAIGVVPFLIGDLAKCALAALLIPNGWAILQRFR
jgi:biotin transport system substrate-specific component